MLMSFGYWASDTLATNESLQTTNDRITITEAKADYILDIQIQSLLAQIQRIQSKPQKTIDDREQVKYLREEVKRIREISKVGDS